MSCMLKKITALLLVTLLLFTSVPFAYASESERFVITFRSPEGIRGSSFSASAAFSEDFDTCFGNQLTGMARELYDAFVLNFVENKNPAEFTLTFSSPYKYDSVGNLSRDVDISGQAALDAFHFDHPEVFWLRVFGAGYSYSYSGGKIVLRSIDISLSEIYINASQDIDAFDNAVNTAASEIGNRITDKENRQEVLRIIHDYICENAVYASSFDDERIYSAAGFFTGSKNLVCEGYSKTFKILCDVFSIPCVLICGTADTNAQLNAPHMWNYVQMEDGKWYLVDVTWDDQESRIYDTYFLAHRNSDGFYKKLCDERREDGDFSNTGKKIFSYPSLTDTAYIPHTHAWNPDYTVDKEPSCKEEGIKSIHCSGCLAVKDETAVEKTEHNWKTETDRKICTLCGEAEIFPTEPTTEPSTQAPTEPSTVPSTQAPTQPATEPLTVPSTQAPTKPVTEPSTVPSTQAPTQPVTEPVTVPSTQTPTQPVTEPATVPSTQATTKPATEPATEPVTVPSTQATTQPVTESLTVPSTQAPTEQTTQPVTAEPEEPSENEHKHTEEIIPGIEATYKATGLTEGKKCSECGEILEKQKKISRKKLAKVKGLKAKSVSTTSVKLSFKKVKGADSYKVYYSTNGKKWKSVKTDKTTVTVKKLKPGTKYIFKVKAVAGTNIGEASSTLKKATKLKQPALSSLKSAKKGTVTVSWKTVKGANGYIVEYSTSKKFKNSKKVTVKKQKSKKTLLKKLKSGKKYYIRVKAYKTVNGKKLYSKASTSKNIKVR